MIVFCLIDLLFGNFYSKLLQSTLKYILFRMDSKHKLLYFLLIP